LAFDFHICLSPDPQRFLPPELSTGYPPFFSMFFYFAEAGVVLPLGYGPRRSRSLFCVFVVLFPRFASLLCGDPYCLLRPPAPFSRNVSVLDTPPRPLDLINPFCICLSRSLCGRSRAVLFFSFTVTQARPGRAPFPFFLFFWCFFNSQSWRRHRFHFLRPSAIFHLSSRATRARLPRFFGFFLCVCPPFPPPRFRLFSLSRLVFFVIFSPASLGNPPPPR